MLERRAPRLPQRLGPVRGLMCALPHDLVALPAARPPGAVALADELPEHLPAGKWLR